MLNDSLDSDSKQPVHINDLICFAIYSASTAMNRAYQPYLSKLGLTYPQYITLSALWQNDGVTVGSLCRSLKVETNTLTPLLKRLEKQGLIARKRGKEDERQVIIWLTNEGRNIKQHQSGITDCVIAETDIDHKTLDDLVASITKLRDNLNGNNG